MKLIKNSKTTSSSVVHSLSHSYKTNFSFTFVVGKFSQLQLPNFVLKPVIVCWQHLRQSHLLNFMLAIVLMRLINQYMLKFAPTSNFNCSNRSRFTNSRPSLTISLTMCLRFISQPLTSEIKNLIETPNSASSFEFLNFLD